MKDPSETHRAIELDDFGHPLICAEDGKEWPCKAWRKWTKSKGYRIAELERRVDALTLDVAGNRKTLAELRTAVHRNELITAAQIEWLAGLNQTTGHAAGIDVRREAEEVEVTSIIFDSGRRTIPNRKAFEVRYGDGEWKH